MPQIIVENLVKTFRVSERAAGLWGAVRGVVPDVPGDLSAGLDGRGAALSVHRELMRPVIRHSTGHHAGCYVARAAEAKPVDQRTDVFSVGVILYEMATGVRPFTGDTSVSIISSILKDTPKPITDLNPGLPRVVLVSEAR